MYLDLEDLRPDTPRVPTAISVREGVLLSLVLHAAILLFILFGPSDWFQPSPAEEVAAQPEPLRYVKVTPLVIRNEAARNPENGAIHERAPRPDAAPVPRATEPERTAGAPEAQPVETPAPPAPEPPPVSNTAQPVVPQEPPRTARGNLGQAFRNLERYLQNPTYETQGSGDGAAEADVDIRDSQGRPIEGIDFGPWLRRFAAQIRRNWVIPQVAEIARGRVVVTFAVLRNGTILNLQVARPATIEALTTSAVGALRLSNPTAALPSEYQDDRVLFTVTFHYNENVRGSP